MNILKTQAEEFVKHNFSDYRGEYKKFIDSLETQLYYYKKPQHKLEFVDTVRSSVKKKYDEHLKTCKSPNGGCVVNTYCENVLFFINNTVEELEGELSTDSFTTTEKLQFENAIQNILTELQTLKDGQQITYDDFKVEFAEMKEYFFMDKRTWTQMLNGKLLEMVAGGIISETVSKGIVEAVSRRYSELIG